MDKEGRTKKTNNNNKEKSDELERDGNKNSYSDLSNYDATITMNNASLSASSENPTSRIVTLLMAREIASLFRRTRFFVLRALRGRGRDEVGVDESEFGDDTSRSGDHWEDCE